jgi:hypothetical protein
MREQNISEKILAKIKSGELKMKPRWFFSVKALLIFLLAVLSFLITIFLVSFIHFTLSATGAWLLFDFGLGGLPMLFFAFPWLIFGVIIVFLIALALIAKRFSFAYRRPAIFGVCLILLLTALGSLFFRTLPFHAQLLKYSNKKNPPIIGPFYRHFGKMPCNRAFIGDVSSSTANGFIIASENHNNCAIRTASSTTFPKGSDINIGDTILVAGKGNCQCFNAMGVRKIKPEEKSLFLLRPAHNQ